MKRMNESDTTVMSSIVGADAKFSGRLFLKGSARIDGTFEGILVSEGTITIGQKGIVTGEVEADQVVVGGKLVGAIAAKSGLVLEGTAVLEGDLATGSLIVSEGAVFNGRSSMGPDAVKQLRQRMQEARGDIIPETINKGVTLYDDDGVPLDEEVVSSKSQAG